MDAVCDDEKQLEITKKNIKIRAFPTVDIGSSRDKILENEVLDACYEEDGAKRKAQIVKD